MKGFPDLPPIWLAGALALGWWLGRAVPILRFDAGWLGAVLFWAGLALITWAVAWFFLRRTPVEPHHTPKVLLAGGPFRLSRNPIYLGMAILLAGCLIGWGALSGLVVLPVFVWIIGKRFIVREETVLRDTFGAEADAFFARTRRWL